MRTAPPRSPLWVPSFPLWEDHSPLSTTAEDKLWHTLHSCFLNYPTSQTDSQPPSHPASLASQPANQAASQPASHTSDVLGQPPLSLPPPIPLSLLLSLLSLLLSPPLLPPPSPSSLPSPLISLSPSLSSLPPLIPAPYWSDEPMCALHVLAYGPIGLIVLPHMKHMGFLTSIDHMVSQARGGLVCGPYGGK